MVGLVRAFSTFPSLDPCFQDPVSFCPIDNELSTGRFKIMTECQDCGFESSHGTACPQTGTHPESELPGETRIMAKKEGCKHAHVCMCPCKRARVQCLHLAPEAWSSPGLHNGVLVLVLFRFGVIHSVFTNLLLWTNGVLNESKHQLNEHKERLITLGFGNITIGE